MVHKEGGKGIKNIHMVYGGHFSPPMSLSFFGVAPRSKQIQTNRRLIEMEIELPEDQEVGGENKKSSCNQVILGRFHLGHCCLDSLARDSPMLRLKKCNRLSIN